MNVVMGNVAINRLVKYCFFLKCCDFSELCQFCQLTDLPSGGQDVKSGVHTLWFPRYRINQFDQYRICFDLTRLILKWEQSIKLTRSWSISRFISRSRSSLTRYLSKSIEVELSKYQDKVWSRSILGQRR